MRDWTEEIVDKHIVEDSTVKDYIVSIILQDPNKKRFKPPTITNIIKRCDATNEEEALHVVIDVIKEDDKLLKYYRWIVIHTQVHELVDKI